MNGDEKKYLMSTDQDDGNYFDSRLSTLNYFTLHDFCGESDSLPLLSRRHDCFHALADWHAAYAGEGGPVYPVPHRDDRGLPRSGAYRRADLARLGILHSAISSMRFYQ